MGAAGRAGTHGGPPRRRGPAGRPPTQAPLRRRPAHAGCGRRILAPGAGRGRGGGHGGGEPRGGRPCGGREPSGARRRDPTAGTPRGPRTGADRSGGRSHVCHPPAFCDRRRARDGSLASLSAKRAHPRRDERGAWLHGPGG
ncbi:MAG: hypothetical protein EHM71_18620 [Zetaproteobacteria bacterium]|nr:MAG: hypothetical protein EHM71_18620 [Zetaproteobacteria bacterium]